MLLNTWELVNTWNIPEVVSDEQPSGGWEFWDEFEKELARRKRERERRLRDKRKAQKIAAKLDREIALEFRKQEEETARKAELARINRLVANNRDAVLDMNDPVIIKSMEEALERQSFSTMERLERQLNRMYEEEQFLLMATQILVNQ